MSFPSVQDQLSTFGTLAVSVQSDTMIVAEDTNTLLGPRVALGRAHTKSIENGCDAPVREQTGQISDQLFSRSIGLPTMLPAAVLRNFQHRVIAALPVQFDIQHSRLDGDEDICKNRC